MGWIEVRADSADRIYAAPLPEALEPRVSIPRIFALGLVLPFTHLNRLTLAGLLPAALIAGFFLTPLGRSAIDWLGFFVLLSRGLTPEPMGSANAAYLAGLALFLAIALWLCAWQRGAARGFAEPVGRALVRSLLRFPGYALALVFWLIAPFTITLPATFVIGWTLQRSIVKARYGMPTGLGIPPDMLTPVQWWVAGIGTLTFSLLGLWVSARLLPLPALVSSQGWSRSLGKAWRLSSGHDFGLSVSLFVYSLIGLFVAAIASLIVFVSTVSTGSDADVVAAVLLSLRIGTGASLAGAALVLFWQTAIAALLVREGANLDDPLELATFD
jgi:hypothetical protein